MTRSNPVRDWIMIGVGSLIIAGGAVMITSYEVKDHNKPVAQITEDDPRWDCHTMGNTLCGDDAAHLLATPLPEPMKTDPNWNCKVEQIACSLPTCNELAVYNAQLKADVGVICRAALVEDQGWTQTPVVGHPSLLCFGLTSPATSTAIVYCADDETVRLLSVNTATATKAAPKPVETPSVEVAPSAKPKPTIPAEVMSAPTCKEDPGAPSTVNCWTIDDPSGTRMWVYVNAAGQETGTRLALTDRKG